MVDAAIAAAISLIENVSSFLDKEVNLKKSVQDDIRDVRNWLRTIQAYLKDMDGKGGSALQIDRAKQLRDIAYDIEDVLDEFRLHVRHRFSRNKLSQVVHDAAHYPTCRLALHELSRKIHDIRRKKDNLKGFDPRLYPDEGSSSSSRLEDRATYQIPEEDEIVGFEEQKATLIQMLQEGEARRMTLSVAGTAGSGKSTLVRSVYDDKSVLSRYDCHAWIDLSPSFKTDEVLRGILGQFCGGWEEKLFPHGMTVQEKLKRHLEQRRYLLVLDDLWSKEDWSSERHVLKLEALSRPDAWNLFCKKAFGRDGKCPEELLEYSLSILKKCEGLPFAIVAVGSLLSTREKKSDEFQKFLNSLGSEIGPGSDLSNFGKVLLPSYKDLSGKSNLKSCFMYFSIFPEDYSIKRGRLIRLWIAEGFIKAKRGKTKEMVAEDYLNELIGRNLIHVSSRDFAGRVSTCRVLNLVREFLIEKSTEENFVKILAKSSTGSSDEEVQHEEVQVRRLSIQYGWPQNKDLVLGCVRALFMFQWHDSLSSKIGKLLHRFKLLKILDLEGAPLETFPKEIVKLTLLSYLSLRETKIETIPKSIKKLAYLETLNLKQTYVTELPSEIFSLQFLRHLLVYRYNVKNYVTFESVQGMKVPAGIGTLCKLQKLSLLRANSKVIEELEALTCLRKLGLLDLKEKDGPKLCDSIKKMGNLLTLDVSSTGPEEYLYLDHMGNHPRFLQRLYLKGRLEKLPGWISSSSLDSLVRIYLKWSKLNTDNNPLWALQALPNLLELQMVDSYMGESLEFMANSFQKLKILHLEQFASLNMVVVQTNAMPKLEKLTLCKCEKLEILPLGISELTHLEELLLFDMNESFLNRLKKDCEDRLMVDHIKIIHSYRLERNGLWSFQNLS
ncbi:disease resistance protein RPM1-like isoform X2 [Herrania umbratica]|uniref:Disease resistance protein RPM1-like isoform X2 n=1 Tax=Herrania umbratica TaxID=108875 RepID=A0A6J1ALI6_9ROSI|nr:disease resistance protein RPM1-like isoform X2 [Herrania umbratica]